MLMLLHFDNRHQNLILRLHLVIFVDISVLSFSMPVIFWLKYLISFRFRLKYLVFLEFPLKYLVWAEGHPPTPYTVKSFGKSERQYNLHTIFWGAPRPFCTIECDLEFRIFRACGAFRLAGPNYCFQTLQKYEIHRNRSHSVCKTPISCH